MDKQLEIRTYFLTLSCADLKTSNMLRRIFSIFTLESKSNKICEY